MSLTNPNTPVSLQDLQNFYHKILPYLGTSAVPTKVSDLTNDSGFITNTVNNLVNYYLSSQLYTKTEIDSIVTAIKNSRFEAVSSLPTSNIKTNVIYLVPASSSDTNNIKDEYINLDGTTAGWEKIGSTSIDLTGYVTVTTLNTALADYTNTTNLTSLLATKQDTIQVSTMPTASATTVNKIYQFMGTTDSTYTHGYFYETKQNNSTYSWQQVNVQPSTGGGHTIIDGNGTQLNQETNLKFSKDFDVSDDSTNHNTEVEQHEISPSEWDEIMATVPSPGATVTPAGFTPVGTIISVMGTTAPQNYLACDGTVYNISQYQVLANYIKDQFGSYNKFGGDGTTTFAVPDLRGEFLRGTGTNSHTNQGNGANVGEHQNASESNPGFTNTSGGGYGLTEPATSTWINSLIKNADSWHNYGTRSSFIYTSELKQTTNSSDTIGYATLRPTNTSVLYCIAAYNIYVDARFDYSTEEKVIGTWINGKPIYQKVFPDLGVLPSTDAKSYQHEISNIDTIIDARAFSISSDDTQYIPLSYAHPTATANSVCFIAYKDHFWIRTGSAHTGDHLRVIFSYTKTTD